MTSEQMEQRSACEAADKEAVKQVINHLRPHFIFNVLNQLRYFIRKDPEAAYKLTYDFANYLRDRIEGLADDSYIPLSIERKRLESYLALECMGLQLHVSYEWEDFLDGQTFWVRSGILITEAEQFIKNTMRSSGSCHNLTVQGEQQGDTYVVSILAGGEEEVNRIRIPCMRKEPDE